MENKKYIRFRNKRIISYIFDVHIDKNNKITKAIKRKIKAGPQASLNIKLNEAEVLWPVGLNNRHNDFPSEHASYWKLKHLELQIILLFDTKILKT